MDGSFWKEINLGTRDFCLERNVKFGNKELLAHPATLMISDIHGENDLEKLARANPL